MMQYSIFIVQWTENTELDLLPNLKVWEKICPILFQKLPKKMWENIK